MINVFKRPDRAKRLSIPLMVLVAVCVTAPSAHGLDLNYKALDKAHLAALATAVRGNGFPCPSISKARKVNENKDGHMARLTCVSEDRKKRWDIRISNLPHGPAQFSYWDDPPPPKPAPLLPINSDIRPHGATITDLEYSGDGNTLYSVSKTESRLIAWQVASMHPVAEHAVRSMSLSPNRQMLIGIGDKIEILNADAGTRLRSFPVPTFSVPLPLNALAINNQATQFALAWDSEVILYDAKSGRKTASLWGLNGSVIRLNYTPDGQYLIAGGYSNVVIWDARTSTKVMALPMAVAFVQDDVMGLTKGFDRREPVAFTPVKRANIRFNVSNTRFHGSAVNGDFATTNAAFNVLEIRNLVDGRLVKRVNLPERHDRSDIGRISPDMQMWASSKRDRSISVVNLQTGGITASENASAEPRRFPDDGAVSYCEKAIGQLEGAVIHAVDAAVQQNRVSFRYETKEQRSGMCEFSIGAESHTLQKIELNETEVGEAELRSAAEAANSTVGSLFAGKSKLNKPIDGPPPACCSSSN